ncbi:MAG: hypothetical protein IPP56_12670 [Bacteroidetes bacterium]|nr:hypothetical protein [Bacteroidota bacterium]
MKQKFTPLVFRLILAASLGLVNLSFAQYCMPTGTGALYVNSCNVGSNNYIKNVTLIGTTLNNTTGCTANVPEPMHVTFILQLEVPPQRYNKVLLIT